VYGGARTLGAILEARAAEQPERELVRFEHGALTYGVFDEQASRVANALGELGLAKGDKAAIQLANSPEYLAAWFGMARAGIVEVPLNVGLRGDLLAYVLNQAECSAFVVAAEWLPRLAAIAGRLETLRHVVVVGEADGDAGGVATIPFAELLTADATRSPVVVEPHDVSVILFTSGTTGPSKGVVLSHNANFRLATVATIDVMDYAEDERLYTAFPLFHVNAKYTSVLPAMILDRGSLVMRDRFSASRFWDVCRAEDVTAFNFMGALLLMLQKQPERPDDLDNPVRKGFGAPAPAAITPDFERRFGVQLCEMYGTTEFGNATGNRPSDRVIGSCGRALPDCEVEIHDEHDNPLPPGVEGEIVVRPRTPHQMIEEYYRMPEASLQAFRNLWFHSGDRGRTDENGFFYYVDRMKDAIRRRGENISSWEVEQVLNAHDAVEESAALGVPSELTEEEVLVVVKLKPAHELAPEALLDFAQERLPHFAVPRYVRFVDELPKNPAQRIEKYRLREEGVTADTWDRESVGYVVVR
jgi:crotonobetaine/carnitine-CoA ligase